MGMGNAIAFFFFLVLGIGTAKLAQWENDRERMELVARTGGEGSPWLASPAMTTARVEVKQPSISDADCRQFWDGIEKRFSKEEIEEIERYPWIGVDLPATAPEPTPLHTPETLVPPAVELVASTGGATGGMEAVELSPEDWLEQNKCHFPVPIPPIQVRCYGDRKALMTATIWITRAMDAGVSQNKITGVVFQATKKTKAYDAVLSIIKEIQR